MGVLSWARQRSAPVERFQLLDRVGPAARAGGLEARHAEEAVFAVAAEAVLLQDQAEAVLESVARGDHLGLVAPRAGPLVHRFFTLRDALPQPRDPWLQARVSTLDTILLHHAMQLSTAMEFLAVAGRSDRLTRAVATYAGLGRPAELLDQTYADLRDRRLRWTQARDPGHLPQEHP